MNKRKHELLTLKVNEAEADIVRRIYGKYVNEGYGAQRIATWLNNQGYRARSGKPWHHASIRGILAKLTYTGVLRCGEARSEILPELQIIPPELYEAAERIRSARSKKEEIQTVPMNTRGKSLLSGNVYCGHCGARLSLTTNGKYRRKADGTMDTTQRIRYVCYGKTRKQTECDGPTGYTMHILDDIIDKTVRELFEKLRGVPKHELISARYTEELTSRRAHLAALREEYAKAVKEMETLQSEIILCIQGKSVFSRETLSKLVEEAENKCKTLRESCERAEDGVTDTTAMLNSLHRRYDEMISYADLYDQASHEAKKMIVSQLIQRVDVYRDYKIVIKFNFHVSQFLGDIGVNSAA